MTLHVLVSFAIYQLYKVTSQVSLVTALIEEDHFLYLSSFMDKYFSGNAFKFLIFFNLLKENATVFPYSNMFFPQIRRVDMYLSRLSPCT